MEALNSLREVERIFEHNHGDEISAKICKVKRNISLLCLKLDENAAALDELKQVEDLERALYGENSTQLGKTYKVIGTIHLLNKSHADAREYLGRAQAIFELKGQIKLLKEVKSKLRLLQPGRYNLMFGEDGANAAQMLGISVAGVVGAQPNTTTAAMTNVGIDSEEDVTADELARKGSAGTRKVSKKKKAAYRGKQFNNFMNEK